MSAEGWVWFVMLVSAGSLLMAVLFTRQVLGADTGTAAMQEIAAAIKEGAEAFLRRQYSTIYMLSLALAAVIFFFYLSSKGMTLAWKTTVAFAVGAICSGIAGFSGMFVSIRANLRAASAARSSLARALQLSLRGGAVTGLSVVAMSLLGVGVLFLAFGGMKDPTAVPYQLVGFGFGASFVALFAQLGGGIFTKAADVGADLVGKVEAGIPEDDPRNPAVIADLVGDNVGDCAGRGADLFESTAAENVGAMILGAALFPVFGIEGILFPLVARAFGLIASIVGVLVVKTREDRDPMQALNRGFYVTTVLALIGFYAAVQMLLKGNMMLFAAGVVGIATSFLFVYITQYYTEYKYRPVQSIAKACLTGPATTIISGFAIGLECVAAPVLVISAAIMSSYYLGINAGLTGVTQQSAGLYGTAIATMGMLSTAAYILAMDTFGPITDNAGGIIEMSRQPEDVRKKTDRLDAVGNTTKALTKGYAIGSAALAAFLLFSAYLDEVAHYGSKLESVNIAKPEVFVGGLLGAMLVFLFSALAIRAVGKAAYYVINEVRRQFKENPNILKGTAKPDYRRCVDIVTVGALKQMIVPGVLAVTMPVAVGLVFRMFGIGAEAVAAFLMVGTIAGILMATFFNNSGGAWDNAKKFIESGQYEGGGKGSDPHKAAVVGDTLGD